MLVFAEIIYSITDPPLRLLRKVLKPVRVGNMMLDLAFIGLAILVSILMQVNAQRRSRLIAVRRHGAPDGFRLVRRVRPDANWVR